MPKNAAGHKALNSNTWTSLLEYDEISLERVYENALACLASSTWNDNTEKSTESLEPPDISDPTELYSSLAKGNRPHWWPPKLDRINIIVKTRPQSQPPANYGPHTIDPNSKDYGKSNFMAIAKNLCESIGTPFHGNVEVSISRKNDKMMLGGWRGEVVVGELAKGDGSRDGEMDAITAHALKSAKDKDEQMLHMFQQSANVITASASAINAMRGANPPAPWMQEGGEGTPFWMQLLGEATKVVLGSGLFGQNPAQAVGSSLMQRVPARRALSASQNPMIAQQDLGYEDYQQQEDGDYDGFSADDEDILEDDMSLPDENESYERVSTPAIEYEMSEDEFEDEPMGLIPGGDINPLLGQSTEKVKEMMEQWIEQHPNKAEVRDAAMSLVGKVIR